jgi:3-deoxy-7-phosphoheptulonate synthase
MPALTIKNPSPEAAASPAVGMTAAESGNDVPGVRTGARTLLPTPRELTDAIAPTTLGRATIENGRETIRRVLRREDDRLLVVIGPCSIHDPDAALEYAHRLNELRAQVEDRLVLVMRAYFEKPRTTVGWKGLINDPHLDNSFDLAEGLRRARHLLVTITNMGLPVATELLDIPVANYLTDLISYGAIGARTTESQPHRALASGLPLPVGFKNGTDGGIQVALDAMVSAREGHHFVGFDDEGRCCVVHTTGNTDTMLILRGGKGSNGLCIPNHDTGSVVTAEVRLHKLGFTPPSLLVDASHANSGYDPMRQGSVCEGVLKQRATGNRSIRGVMIESNLFGGKQSMPPGAKLSDLKYGVSITDGCVGWEDTVRIVERLAG